MILLYLAISGQAVSVGTERTKEQILMYYIIHALARAELNYPLNAKFAHTLVSAT